jgi:hypothetical protein
MCVMPSIIETLVIFCTVRSITYNNARLVISLPKKSSHFTFPAEPASYLSRRDKETLVHCQPMTGQYVVDSRRTRWLTRGVHIGRRLRTSRRDRRVDRVVQPSKSKRILQGDVSGFHAVVDSLRLVVSESDALPALVGVPNNIERVLAVHGLATKSELIL